MDVLRPSVMVLEPRTPRGTVSSKPGISHDSRSVAGYWALRYFDGYLVQIPNAGPNEGGEWETVVVFS